MAWQDNPAECDKVLEALSAQGIGAGVHYPVPVHMQPAYAHLGIAADTFPVTNKAADRILSLPIFPEMSETQIERVVAALEASI